MLILYFVIVVNEQRPFNDKGHGYFKYDQVSNQYDSTLKDLVNR